MSIPMFPLYQQTWNATPPSDIAVEVSIVNADTISACGLDSPGSITISRLVDLLDQPEHDGFGVLSPTQHSFKTAYRLLAEAEKRRPSRARGSVATDSEGGIRVSWMMGKRILKLVCPAVGEREPYLYRQTEDQRGVVIKSPSSDDLAAHLDWITIGSRTHAAGRA